MKSILFTFVSLAAIVIVRSTECGDPHAHYTETDAHNCLNTCDKPKNADTCKSTGPKAGCVCNDGYIKNGRGLCVEVRDCDWNFCGLNEKMAKCPSACEIRSCASLGSPVACPVTAPIGTKDCNVFQCICTHKHLRNDKGECVLEEHCPKTTCKENEVFDHCPSHCSEKCSDFLNHNECTHDPKTEVNCKPACRCQPGFFRNDHDLCISQAECHPQN